MSSRIFLTFACPLKWDDLSDINGEVSRRQCEKCQCSVQRIDESSIDQVEAMRAAEPGKKHCVAIEKQIPDSSFAEAVQKYLLDRFAPLSSLNQKAAVIAFSAFLLAGTFINPLEVWAGDISKDGTCYFPESSKLGGLGQLSENAKTDFYAYELVNELLGERLFAKSSALCNSAPATDFLRDFERGIISKGKVLSLANFMKDNGNFEEASKFFNLYNMFDGGVESKPITTSPDPLSSTHLVASGIVGGPSDVPAAIKEAKEALAESSLPKLEAIVPGLYNGQHVFPKMRPLADELHSFLLKETNIAIEKSDSKTQKIAARLYELIEVHYPHFKLSFEEKKYTVAKQLLEELSLALDASELVTGAHPIGKFCSTSETRLRALEIKYKALLMKSKACREKKHWEDSLFWIHAAGVLRRCCFPEVKLACPPEELLNEIVKVQKKLNPHQQEMLDLWKVRFCKS